MADIAAISQVSSVGRTTGAPLPEAKPAPGADFSDTLASVFTEAKNADVASSETAARFADGDPDVGIHEVVIAAEKANIRVRYAVTLKNKLLDAYRELMNTQV